MSSTAENGNGKGKASRHTGPRIIFIVSKIKNGMLRVDETVGLPLVFREWLTNDTVPYTGTGTTVHVVFVFSTIEKSISTYTNVLRLIVSYSIVIYHHCACYFKTIFPPSHHEAKHCEQRLSRSVSNSAARLVPIPVDEIILIHFRAFHESWQ